MKEVYRIFHPQCGWFAGFDRTEALCVVFENDESAALTFDTPRQAQRVIKRLAKEYSFTCELRRTFTESTHFNYDELAMLVSPSVI